MEFFRTEKELEKDLRPFTAPLLFPDGRRQYASITYGSWIGYKALLDMGETDLTLLRAAKRMQARTRLSYEACFVMVTTLGPWTEEKN